MAEHKEYAPIWEDAGYEPGMGSAWVRLPPSRDKIAVYYFTSADHAISDIALSRIKVGRFSDANDPFELLALNFLRERARVPALQDFREKQNSQFGMLSFSQNWVNPVLWSHYADKHRGICLGFDLNRGKAQEIQYQDARLRDELDHAQDDPTKLSAELQALLTRTKSHHWGYEREVRVIVELAGMIREGTLHFYPFDLDLRLAEVILGPRCTLSLTAVRNLTAARHNGAVTFSSRLASGHFSVVPQESTIP